MTLTLSERVSLAARLAVDAELDPLQPHPLDFSQRDVTITLTGAQWFEIFAKLDGKSLREFGDALVEQATAEMKDWLQREASRR